MTTTINDIADFARILQEQPEWTATLRSLLLTEELLNLPAQFAEFVQETRENNRVANERLTRLEELVQGQGEQLKVQGEQLRQLQELVQSQGEQLRQLQELVQGQGEQLRQLQELVQGQGEQLRQLQALVQGQGEQLKLLHEAQTQMNARHNSIEGRFANYEGGYYERSVRNRLLFRARNQFGFVGPYLAMVNDAQDAPELSQAETLALNSQTVTLEQVSDLHDTDIIISGRDGRHLVIEASITAGENDISRARLRAETLAAITGEPVQPAIVTSLLSEWTERSAVNAGVVIFVIPFP